MLNEVLKDYFNRQIRMYEIGEEGIEKLRESHVAVVGVGGLGSFSSLLLALNGVGRLTLIEPDIVEFSNLNRQILYYPMDVWLFKAEAAYNRLKRYAPHVDVRAYPVLLTPRTIELYLKDVDIILDGLDNMSSRYLVNRFSIRHGIPYIFTGVGGFEYNVSFIHPPETPCLECFYRNMDDKYVVRYIRERGIINFTVGHAASIQVAEAVKYLIGMSPSLRGRLMIGDLKSLSPEYMDVKKDPECSACASPTYNEFPSRFYGVDTVVIDLEGDINLDDVIDKFGKDLILVRRGKLGVVFSKDKTVIGISKYGTLVIKNAEDHVVDDIISRILD